MAKLIYGKGSCTIEGGGVKGVQIHYTGAVKITDKTSNSYHIVANKKVILIFPIADANSLTELFEYSGQLKINSAKLAGDKGGRINCSIQPVLDYSQYINTKAEDLAVKSEHIRAGYNYKNPVLQTTIDNAILKNRNTNTDKIQLYNKNGGLYSGDFHIHPDGRPMTGGEHSELSEDLYIKKTTGEIAKPNISTAKVSTRNRRSAKTVSRGRGY